MRRRSLAIAAGAACICAYFLYFTIEGIGAGFAQDEPMNLYRAWRHSWWEHLRDIVCFWRSSEMFRPTGSAFYRAMYALFGIDSVPYRIACHVLLLCNLALAGAVARRLTGSVEVGMLTALLLAVHGNFWPLYARTSFIFDILAVTFFCAALLAWLNGRRILALALYVVCVSSKEVAVSWPVVVLVWELLIHPPRNRTWPFSEARFPMIAGAMTAAFIAGRLYGSGGLTGLGDYRPEISWSNYAAHVHHWTMAALYEPEWLTPAMTAGFAMAACAGALVSRSRPLLLACVWAPVAVLPLAFIRQRGLESVSIALVAVAMYLGVVIESVSRRLMPVAGRWEQVRAVSVFAVVLALLTAAHLRYWHGGLDYYVTDGRKVEAVMRQFGEIRSSLSGVKNVLILIDPWPDHPYDSLMWMKTVANDDAIEVHRLDRLRESWTEPVVPPFDLVLRWEDGHFERCASGPYRSVPVERLRSDACVVIPLAPNG